MVARIPCQVLPAAVTCRLVVDVEEALIWHEHSVNSFSRGRSLARSASPFSAFVTRVLVNAEVKMPVVLTTLAYIERARPHLQIALEEWACERVFLGALICSNKVRTCSLRQPDSGPDGAGTCSTSTTPRSRTCTGRSAQASSTSGTWAG